MAAAITEQEAHRRAEARDCTPLEPYPGTGKKWRLRHNPCGREVMQTANALRASGACFQCGAEARAQAKSQRFGVRATEAARQMDLTPLEPYPGEAQTPWRVRCNKCGDVRTPRAGDIVGGHRVRCSCYDQAVAARAARPVEEIAEELAEYGVILTGRPPRRRWKGDETPGEGACIECGDSIEVRLGSLRSGSAKGCTCDPSRLMSREGGCAECDEPILAGGLCRLHYNRQFLTEVSKQACTVEGCGNGQVAAGLCSSHYSKGADHIIGAEWGWNPNKPATLYLIRDQHVWKYGKAMRHRLRGRLAQHAWHEEVVDLRHGLGSEVTAWERTIRHNLREAGIRPTLDGRDGQRETHYRDDLDPIRLDDLLVQP